MDAETKRQRRREYNRRYNERHPETRKESLNKYNNKPEVKERVQQWHKDNAGNVSASRKKWYHKNKEDVFAKAAEFARKNPAWKAAHCAKRRCIKLRARPEWLTEEHSFYLEEIYHLSQKRKEVTGHSWVVDHIVPLQGRKVRGLHVPWNLQIITSSENSIKGNRFAD